MKFFLLFFIVIPHLIVAQPPIIEWQKSIGGSFREFPEKIISTTDGGYAITGYSESNNFDVPFNAGSYDIYNTTIQFVLLNTF